MEDFAKYQSQDGSSKPRNNFSQRALRYRVGDKKVKGTMSCIRLPSALIGSSIHIQIKSMENITKEKYNKVDLEGIEKIEERPDEDEKSEAPTTGTKKVKGFLVADNDEDSDGSSSSGDEADKEDDRKDAMELVDDDLKKLLLSFDSLERPSAEQIQDLKVEFGKVDRQKTLILDMDETLIHAKPKIKGNEDFDFDFEITLHDEEGELVFMVKMRPGLVECLERLATFYEVVVFTAAERTYATKIIKHFDPNGDYIKRILSREHCIHVDNYYVKDLRIISDRKMEDLCIVDNSIVAFAFNLDNGVPINDFRGDEPMDEELIYMTSYLEDIYHYDDIREPNISNFKLSEIQQNARKS
jgi:Dullard-like phosphatase family protein